MAFKSFVMFAAMRTGSNFLEANLNAMTGLTCHGEVFNPAFIGKLNRTELFGMDLAAREADPLRLLSLLHENTEGMSGFRQFQDHDPRVTEAVLNDPTCAKIILTRNPLEAYVSLLIARETDQWRLTHARKLRSSKVRFNAAEFEAHLDGMQDFYHGLIHQLQITGQTAFHIDYADLQDITVLNGLARFLGAEALERADDKLKKQNPEPITDKVENPEEVEAALARIDRFDLTRIPNFEPRRGIAIPGIVALRDLPLAYVPVPGASDRRVTEWMHSLGDVHEQFDWRSFRRWRGRNAGYVGFTVLGHPLARAHDAFCRMLGGSMPEIRRVLARSYGLAMPDAPDLTAHRDTFLRFLGFLKLNVAGQTSVRVAGPFASQVATVQGMAAFRTPDLVLRPDRLEQGLAFIAAEMGLPMPPLPPETDTAPFPLAAFVDDEIEAACRDAYRRDYDTYAFTDWREG